MNIRKLVSPACAFLLVCGLLSGCQAAPRSTVFSAGEATNGNVADSGFDSSVSDESWEESSSAMVSAVSRKLVKTVSMELQSRSFDHLTESIRQAIEQAGGYAESAELQSYQEDRRSYYILARIPEQNLNRFLDGVETAVSPEGTVVSRQESVEDITLNYVDAESRKKALLTEQERLLELIGQAADISDIIALEERLSQVQYQLESYESQLRVYDNQVEYASVNLHIIEVARVTETPDGSFGERIRTGLADTLYNIGQGAQNFAVWAVVNLPYLLFAAAVVVGGILLLRRRQKGKKKLASLPVESLKEPPEAPEKNNNG